MLEQVLQFVADLGAWAYLIIFVLVALQAAVFVGFLVPGATMAVFGGFLASHGALNLPLVLLTVAAAAVLGNLIGYELGHRVDRAWLLGHTGRFGLRAQHLHRVDRFFELHGGKTLLLGRFSPPLRALVPFVAGASRFPFRPFVLYSIASGIGWAAISVMLGYLAGASWQIAQRWLGRVGAVGVALLIVLIVLGWLQSLPRRWGERGGSG
jgi:membrane protein DedA with SNARE-associated domain